MRCLSRFGIFLVRHEAIICHFASGRSLACVRAVDDVSWYQDTAALFKEILGIEDGILEDCSSDGVEGLYVKDLLIDGEQERGSRFQALDIDGERWSALFVVATNAMVMTEASSFRIFL